MLQTMFIIVVFMSVAFSCPRVFAGDHFSGWKRIWNKNGFSVEVPPEWNKGSVTGAAVSDEIQVVVTGGNKNRSVRIQVGESAARCCMSSAKAMVEDHIKFSPGGPNAKISEHPLIIDGAPAFEGIYIDQRMGPGTVVKYIGVQHHGAEFFFQIEEHGPDAVHDKDTSTWKYKKEIDRIVKSFRFTN